MILKRLLLPFIYHTYQLTEIMKNLKIVVCLALFLIIAGSIFLYRILYYNHIGHTRKFLDHQTGITALKVNETNNSFDNDLNQIVDPDEISLFFLDKGKRSSNIEKMKVFFTRYENLITGIKYFDNDRNEFTLKRDETGKGWLEQQFILHVQGEIYADRKIMEGRRSMEYYLPVRQNNTLIGNLVITVDFRQYFADLLSSFNVRDLQLLWVINDSGKVVYSTGSNTLQFPEIERIKKESGKDSQNISHRAKFDDKSEQTLFSYHPVTLLESNFGLIFSSPVGLFRKFLLRNTLLFTLLTILAFMLAVYMLWKRLVFQDKEIKRLDSSEKMLFRMIEEMPVGIIIHNSKREIIRANKMAATQYSYETEAEMTGKIYPEISVSDNGNYFSKNLGGTFSPDQFVIIKKEIGETILFRNTIPVNFMGQEASLEMLVDVTMLENARKNEANANEAKSEFLARMSYELRTPLNGIIGMSDILRKRNLPREENEILKLLQRSAGVLLNIIDDILDFSKIETGKIIIEELPFNLREEIVYCYDLARANINEERIRFSCTVDDDIPERLIGDPYRLRQIITNILNHSIENTSDGEISLKCRLEERKDRMLRLGFEVADTGKAFDNATLKKIFGDYVNLESKVISNDDGPGFGTILARQLIQLLGGTLNAESPSGIDGSKGSLVTFSIVTYSDEKATKNLPLENTSSFKDVKTLVITGSLSRDEDVLGILHKLGLSISVTTYQKSTVSQIKANLGFPSKRNSLIVIINNDEFDGFKVAEEIQENGLPDQFILIMMSTDDSRGNYLKCLSLGIDHYIVRPFELQELYDAIISHFPGIDRPAPSGYPEEAAADIKILIVEDNKMNQKVIGTMLKSLGYSFDFADDGYSGYIQARTRRYDVIFMDLIMPEMDGYESARKMLEHDPTLLIAAFTADNLPESKRKAELSGIRDFISKPVRIDDLKKFFTRHFNKNKKLSSSLPEI